MKNVFYTFFLMSLLVLLMAPLSASSQCGVGTANFNLDWSLHDFLARENATKQTYITAAQTQTQYFAFGRNKLTIVNDFDPITESIGENPTHTGDAGSFGTGDDVQFSGNGTITFRFASAVSNLKFSLFDIDRNQTVTITATNAATAVIIVLTKPLPASGPVLLPPTGTSVRATSGDAAVPNTSTDGTVNVSIDGLVTDVRIVISNTGTTAGEAGEFWLSDIAACTPDTFPFNYYNVSRPFNGMPNYTILVRNNAFYYFDPGTGKCFFIFTDVGNNNINSMAYDPYNREIYYTFSLSNGGSVNVNEKKLRRYSYDNNSYAVLVDDVTNPSMGLGFPSYQQGVESGAAGFYDGNYYMGIEGRSYTESTVWRVELNALRNPIGYSQVMAQQATEPDGNNVVGGGGIRLHDWSDFGISDGILYDFNGSATNYAVLQYNLRTGASTKYMTAAGTQVPRQTTVDWQGRVYNVGSSGGGADLGTIGLYNGTNSFTFTDNVSLNGIDFVGGSYGDGAEAFRPVCDFGDAPITYESLDPTWGLAVHERNGDMRIGPNWSSEWLKRGTTANNDTYDDGITFVQVLLPGDGEFVSQVTVNNNTAANATLIGWLDYNGNGIFDASEAVPAITVPPSASPQSFYLYWPATPNSLSRGTYTYLRVRMTNASAGMTTANATGYYELGEVEDYRVIVENYPLAVTLLSFKASLANISKVNLNWKTCKEEGVVKYELERSTNNNQWQKIAEVFATGNDGGSSENVYDFADTDPLSGTSYYRLKIINVSSAGKYSEIQTVINKVGQLKATLVPNPASTKAELLVTTSTREKGEIIITDLSGRIVHKQSVIVVPGKNSFTLPIEKLSKGAYLVLLNSSTERIIEKLLVNKN